MGETQSIQSEHFMTYSWRWAAAAAIALYLVLFAIAFISEWRDPHTDRWNAGVENGEQNEVFSNARKNYASVKQAAGPAAQPIGDSQKYEKIASLTQRSSSFEADRARIDATIATNMGLVQIERGVGLKGRRILYLGIGVPPEKFDSFIEAARAIGTTALITTVKNDKTNEYLQLRAKRASLEKARTALEALQGSGGSVDERIHVLSQLTDIEEKIQALGISLGDFDSQNELCTIKLTLQEVQAPRRAALLPMLVAALGWSSLVYAGIGCGFLALMIASWALAALVARVRVLADGLDRPQD